jgi:hypothetical protein
MDALHAGWQVHRINHFEAYCTGDACANWAESFFSRLRRLVDGQHQPRPACKICSDQRRRLFALAAGANLCFGRFMMVDRRSPQ